MSSLWVGTPVYILGETINHEWLLVMTPEYIAWVKSKGIARVSEKFVTKWQTSVHKQLAAIIKTNTSVFDNKNQFLFSAYVGTVLPALQSNQTLQVMVPFLDKNQQAGIKYAALSSNEAVSMPLKLTPHSFSTILKTLIKRPYGWGNLYFYNDCSAELKNLFAPFGIWLPRHSSNQIEVGTVVDMTSYSKEKRLAYLMEQGHDFLTIVYIGGHVLLYIGNFPNPNTAEHNPMAMTYQNIWGLSPKPANRRAVIGQAVLFPMLLQYPEDSSLSSLADKKYFQVAFIDQISEIQPSKMNLKLWMDPDV